MSTRATYRFEFADRYAPPVTYYIHHDGYPSGAAVYFALAVYAEGTSLAARFLRANDRAEFTDGHDAHGDTEYQYTVTLPPCDASGSGREPMLVAKGRPDGGGWRVVYSGTVREFIESNRARVLPHLPPDAIELDADPVAVIYGRDIRPLRHVLRKAEDAWNSAAGAYAQGWTGNAAGSADFAARLCEPIRDIPKAKLIRDAVARLRERIESDNRRASGR